MDIAANIDNKNMPRQTSILVIWIRACVVFPRDVYGQLSAIRWEIVCFANNLRRDPYRSGSAIGSR